MKNEKGITLIELLAVLVLVGLVTMLAMTIFMDGKSAADRNTVNVRLQQEANVIINVVRNTYLLNEKEPFTIRIEGAGSEQKIFVADRLVAEGSRYEFVVKNEECPASLSILQTEKKEKCLSLLSFLEAMPSPDPALANGTSVVMRTVSPEIKLTVHKESKGIELSTTLSKLN